MNKQVLPKWLQWLQLFRPLIERGGIDFDQFALILATKFFLADRNQTQIGLGNSRGNRKPSEHPLRTQFLLNLIFGALIMMMVLMPVALFVQLAEFYSTMFVFFLITMLTTYSSLIINPQDRLFYTVRGVDERTLNLARMVQVAIYMLITIAGMGGPTLVLLAMRQNPLVAIGALIGLLLLSLTCMMLALLIYLVVLRLFDGERLKNILNVVQIVFIISIYLMSQIMPHVMIGSFLYTKFDLAAHWFFVAIPTVWFAGIPTLLAGQISGVAIALAVLSIGASIGMTVVYVRHAGNFEDALSKLEQGSAGNRGRERFLHRASKLFARRGDERAYFTLGWRILQTERGYKLRVYPQLAYALILPVILGLNNIYQGNAWTYIAHGLPFVNMFLVVSVPMLIINLRFSEQPEAMQLFQRIPFAQHGLLLRAVVKAAFARILAPICALIIVAATAMDGAPGLLAAVATTVLMYGTMMGFGRVLGGNALPFSQVYAPDKMGGTALAVGTALIGMLIAMVVSVLGIMFHNVAFSVILLVIGVALAIGVENGMRTGIHYDLTTDDNPDQ